MEVKNKLQQEPLFIAVQGATCSGKTTFSQNLKRNLEKICKVEILSLDNYYKPTPGLDCVNEYYNFDIPGAFDFEGVAQTLEAFANKKSQVVKQKYDFMTMNSDKYYEDNQYPDVVIVEGLYAFNVFQEKVFNTEILDPKQRVKNILESGRELFVKNTFDFFTNNNIKAYKILLSMTETLCRKLRMTRDRTYRFKEASVEFKNNLEKKFDENIWPATKEWVYSPDLKPTKCIEDGTRNNERCIEIFQEINQMFTTQVNTATFTVEESCEIKI